jgi:hypothetical protein
MNVDMLVLKHRVETHMKKTMAPLIPSYLAGRVTPPFSSMAISNKYLLMEGIDNTNWTVERDRHLKFYLSLVSACMYVSVVYSLHV